MGLQTCHLVTRLANVGRSKDRLWPFVAEKIKNASEKEFVGKFTPTNFFACLEKLVGNCRQGFIGMMSTTNDHTDPKVTLLTRKMNILPIAASAPSSQRPTPTWSCSGSAFPRTPAHPAEERPTEIVPRVKCFVIFWTLILSKYQVCCFLSNLNTATDVPSRRIVVWTNYCFKRPHLGFVSALNLQCLLV